uniref:Secreted protein n=1 Tax=Heterorhabditis bacteriophora TaxID=37862 RepID=A0A1I7X5B6_HETBA
MMLVLSVLHLCIYLDLVIFRGAYQEEKYLSFRICYYNNIVGILMLKQITITTYALQLY